MLFVSVDGTTGFCIHGYNALSQIETKGTISYSQRCNLKMKR